MKIHRPLLGSMLTSILFVSSLGSCRLLTALKGHVTSASLVRSDQPGVSLLDIPLDPPTSPLIASGGMIQHPADQSPNLGGLYEIVAGGLAAIELDTDISSQSRVSIPLSVTDKKDWYRPSNCY